MEVIAHGKQTIEAMPVSRMRDPDGWSLLPAASSNAETGQPQRRGEDLALDVQDGRLDKAPPA